MPPTVVVVPGEGDVHKRPPFRALRLANQLHARLGRKPVPLPCVAGYARADNVLPGRLPSAVAGQDMIEIEIAAFKNLPAILAGIAVPLENVVPGEFDFLFRQPLEKQEDDNPRDANVHGNRPNHFRFRIGLGKIAPTEKIMGQKIVSLFRGNHLRVPLIKKSEGPADRAGVHRLPQAVKHENRLI